MKAYPDASFLFSLYIPQAHSARAAAHFAEMDEPLCLTSLSRFELMNAIQLALFRKTVLAKHARGALAAVEEDLATGATMLVPCDWGSVHGRALQIAAQFTSAGGYRGFDILHLATALELEAKEFLSYDARQNTLWQRLRA